MITGEDPLRRLLYYWDLENVPANDHQGLQAPNRFLGIRCKLGDIRLWVSEPSTSSCLMYLTRVSQPTLSLSLRIIDGHNLEFARARSLQDLGLNGSNRGKYL